MKFNLAGGFIRQGLRAWALALGLTLTATMSGQTETRVLPLTSGPVQEPTQAADGAWQVSLAYLASYPLATPPEAEPPPPGSREGIPDGIVRLDGQRVTIRGYIIPTKLEAGRATEFLLLSDPMQCCYGAMPAPNEWVVVKMKGKGAYPAIDTALYVHGTFRVGYVFDSGAFAGVYALECDKVTLK